MSIASEISRISSAKSNILTAIASKGVSTAGATHIEDCPALITAIETGGGGNTLFNTAVTASATASATGYITATQKVITSTTPVIANPTNSGENIGGWGNPSITWQAYRWGNISALDTLYISSTAYQWGSYTAGYTTSTGFVQYSAYQGSYDSRTGEVPISEIRSNYSWLGDLEFVYAAIISYQATDTCTLSSQSTGLSAGGTSYPFPSRPASELIPVTASATATAKYSTSMGVVKLDGTVTSTGTYIGGRSTDSLSIIPAQPSQITDQTSIGGWTFAGKVLPVFTSWAPSTYYPDTAYTFSRPSPTMYINTTGVI